MNIVLLTGANPFNNSGILALDAYKSLKAQGHSVFLLTPNYDPRLEEGMCSIYGKLETYLRNFFYRVKSKLSINKSINHSYYMFGLNEINQYIDTKKILKSIPFQVDLIVYLFPHRFLNARNLYELNKQSRAPICVMPVDMAQFTGGCHYANACEGYKSQCGKCPGLNSNRINDLTYNNLIFKKQYISKTDLFTIGNTWTSNLIKQSSIFAGKDNYFCNVVINEKVYCPGVKDEVRKNFGIPLDKKVILFGATSVNEKRKGFDFLVKALNLLFEELESKERDQLLIVIAGNVNIKIKDILPFDIYSLGHLTHDELPKAFQLADVFVSPSIQDAGPMMVIQSMMCGTPVVAFDMGNAADYVFDDFTGFKPPLYDVEKLKEGIKTILNKSDIDKIRLAHNCRNLAISQSSYVAFEKMIISSYNNFKSKKLNCG